MEYYYFVNYLFYLGDWAENHNVDVTWRTSNKSKFITVTFYKEETNRAINVMFCRDDLELCDPSLVECRLQEALKMLEENSNEE